ncbi:MAG: hypothetical protein IK100_07250 [Muribaculaceae bacterium]|nr:hypothetical protein [Muribaculaceae bacterium]
MSCNRSVDKRLVLADTLMWTRPDSSLAILEAINRDSLQGEENLAYHALLLTQANFRCNIPLTSDSLINSALDYYSDNHNREHYTRSLLYKGGYYEFSANQPVEAIKWFKLAEDNADSTDYRNLAQINMRLGNLYYENYASNNLDLEKFKKALYYYEKLSDKRMAMISLINAANVYRMTDIKTAKNLYNRAELLAKEINDSSNLYKIYINHAVLCLNDSIPLEEGKYFSKRAFEIAGFKENCDYYTLGDIYARLGDLDSAEYCLKQSVTNENTAYDNVVRYKCLMDIALAKKNLADYDKYKKLFDHLSDSLEHNKEKYELSKFESDFDNERIASKAKKVNSLNKTIYFLIASFLVFALVIAAFFIISRKKHKNQQQVIDELRKESFVNYEELRSNLADFDNHFSKTMNEKLKSLEEIMTGAYNPNQDSKSNEVEHNMSPIADDDTKFWEGLYSYLNIKHNGAMDKIANDFPQLSASDLNFIKLMCCGFSDAAIAVCRNYRNVASVRSRKNKIKEKMGIKETLADYVKNIICDK